MEYAYNMIQLVKRKDMLTDCGLIESITFSAALTFQVGVIFSVVLTFRETIVEVQNLTQLWTFA